MREASLAAADFVRCPDHVGEFPGYDYFADGHPLATADGPGYYRRDDAPPPDAREYSRLILQRASAAGAEFVACPEPVMELPAYEFRDGIEGVGYYLKSLTHGSDHPGGTGAGGAGSGGGGGSFDEFMSTMKQLGAA